MGWPVVLVDKGGIPVIFAANGLGVPITIADGNGRGVAVTRVFKNGIPVAVDGSSGYDPVVALGQDLIAYWDAERADLVTQSSGAVSSWRDIVAGYNMVGVGSARPTYSATSFNGAPGVSFDGTDDALTCTDAALLAALPTGATAGEMWAVASQDAAAADATTRFIAAFGGSATVARSLQRISSSGVNRARAQLGDGTSGTMGAVDASVDFTGRHSLRHQVDATTVSLTMNGGTPTVASIVGATAITRVRLGSAVATSPGNFWLGQIAMVMITKPLSVQKAAALKAYLSLRAVPDRADTTRTTADTNKVTADNSR